MAKTKLKRSKAEAFAQEVYDWIKDFYEENPKATLTVEQFAEAFKLPSSSARSYIESDDRYSIDVAVAMGGAIYEFKSAGECYIELKEKEEEPEKKKLIPLGDSIPDNGYDHQGNRG